MTKRVVTDTDIGGTLEIDGTNKLQNKIADVPTATGATDTEQSIVPSVLFNSSVVEKIQSDAWDQQPAASAAQIAALTDNDVVLVKTAAGDILQFRLGTLFTLDTSVVEGALTDVLATGTDIIVNTDLSEAALAAPVHDDFLVGSTVGGANFKVAIEDVVPQEYFTSAPGDIPANPVLGSTLVDDAGDGNMFIRYNDGTNDIWLNASN